jgi:uncharacterized protein YkwD
MNTACTRFFLAYASGFLVVAALQVAVRAAEPNPAAIRLELLKLHNQERKDADQRPLTLNAQLTKAAQAYAEYLAESGEFSHTAKGTMRSRVKDAGYDPRAVGENIASGQTSAAEVVKEWLESKTHKENILREDFADVGFGLAIDKAGEWIWVVDFGSRKRDE